MCSEGKKEEEEMKTKCMARRGRERKKKEEKNAWYEYIYTCVKQGRRVEKKRKAATSLPLFERLGLGHVVVFIYY